MANTTRPQTRVARPLAVVALLLAALLGLVFVKDWKPKLGLDLKGGTSVILTPDESNPNPGKAALNKAVDIIRQRVNGTGVAESEVVTEGNNISVALPAVGRDDALALVGSTAQLTFRHVQQTLPGSPIPPPAPAPPPTPPATTPAPAPSPPATTPAPSPTPSARGRALSENLLAQPQQQPPGQQPPGQQPPGQQPPGQPPPGQPPPGQPPLDPATAQALATLDCNDPAQRLKAAQAEDPAKPLVTCSIDGAKYLLGASELSGTAVRTAVATIDETTGEWKVSLEFTGKGQPQWTGLTRKYTQQQVAVVLDGVVQSAPTIQQEITGPAEITGDFDKKQATDLSNVLKYGSLPLKFDQSDVRTISPTLGRKSVNAGLLAGVIGLAAVLVYSLLYYRGLGLVTVLGLGVFSLFSYALVVILGNTGVNFTLTLAGIAGLIVSVGVTADSYVVFYERLKEEVHDGRTLRASVDRGFQRSFRTLIAADIVSFLAAASLYVLSVGAVRGFAFTLGLATVLDVFIAYFFTRPMVTLLTRTKLFSEGRFVGIRAATARTPQPKEA